MLEKVLAMCPVQVAHALQRAVWACLLSSTSSATHVLWSPFEVPLTPTNSLEHVQHAYISCRRAFRVAGGARLLCSTPGWMPSQCGERSCSSSEQLQVAPLASLQDSMETGDLEQPVQLAAVQLPAWPHGGVGLGRAVAIDCSDVRAAANSAGVALAHLFQHSRLQVASVMDAQGAQPPRPPTPPATSGAVTLPTAEYAQYHTPPAAASAAAPAAAPQPAAAVRANLASSRAAAYAASGGPASAAAPRASATSAPVPALANACALVEQYRMQQQQQRRQRTAPLSHRVRVAAYSPAAPAPPADHLPAFHLRADGADNNTARLPPVPARAPAVRTQLQTAQASVRRALRAGEEACNAFLAGQPPQLQAAASAGTAPQAPDATPASCQPAHQHIAHHARARASVTAAPAKQYAARSPPPLPPASEQCPGTAPAAVPAGSDSFCGFDAADPALQPDQLLGAFTDCDAAADSLATPRSVNAEPPNHSPLQHTDVLAASALATSSPTVPADGPADGANISAAEPRAPTQPGPHESAPRAPVQGVRWSPMISSQAAAAAAAARAAAPRSAAAQGTRSEASSGDTATSDESPADAVNAKPTAANVGIADWSGLRSQSCSHSASPPASSDWSLEAGSESAAQSDSSCTSAESDDASGTESEDGSVDSGDIDELASAPKRGRTHVHAAYMGGSCKSCGGKDKVICGRCRDCRCKWTKLRRAGVAPAACTEAIFDGTFDEVRRSHSLLRSWMSGTRHGLSEPASCARRAVHVCERSAQRVCAEAPVHDQCVAQIVHRPCLSVCRRWPAWAKPTARCSAAAAPTRPSAEQCQTRPWSRRACCAASSSRLPSSMQTRTRATGVRCAAKFAIRFAVLQLLQLFCLM